MARTTHEDDRTAFFRKVEAEPSGCWVWQGAKDRDGYGQARIGMTRVKAHRKMWWLLFGDVPEGTMVLHHCDNPPCVRPNHLYLGTALDNRRDAIDRGRARWSSAKRNGGESNAGARLTRQQVDEIRHLASTRMMTQKAIAAQYGIGQTQVSRIVLGKSWR